MTYMNNNITIEVNQEVKDGVINLRDLVVKEHYTQVNCTKGSFFQYNHCVGNNTYKFPGKIGVAQIGHYLKKNYSLDKDHNTVITTVVIPVVYVDLNPLFKKYEEKGSDTDAFRNSSTMNFFSRGRFMKDLCALVGYFGIHYDEIKGDLVFMSPEEVCLKFELEEKNKLLDGSSPKDYVVDLEDWDITSDKVRNLLLL